MKDFMPTTASGKWSVWLNTFFAVSVIGSVTLVNMLGVLSYDYQWWDITVPILILTTIAALIFGIRAVTKYSERATSIYVSILISVCAILFLLLHSLFISD